ncbi:hypothetical protein CCR75_001474 [Bremia lactucae]|uniref:DNA excision repair protein ERCC-8 n=1 Tax=Bremia lactucae TaxID=4779 RepID=A0A976NZV6_BRELC|nr:hypothetical protein CCR75_001474 [Bremia lactucae]
MVSAFCYLLDRSVGLPSRAYSDNLHARESTTLLQHSPSTSNYIFRQGMRVWSFALDPVEQRFLFVGTSKSQLLVFDLETLDKADFLGHLAYSTTNALDPICTADAKTRNAPTLQFGISMVDWYPADGGICISSSLDEHVKIWDAETFSCVSSLHLRSAVFGAKFSPVSTTHALIAAGIAKGEVRLVDMESGATAHSLLGHQDEIWTLDWSPTSEFIVTTGARDGELRLWDIRRSGATACLLCLNQEGKAEVPRRSNLYTNVIRNSMPMSMTARKRRRRDGASEAEMKDQQRARTKVDSHHARLHASTYRETRNDPHAAASTSLAVAHSAGITSIAYTPDGRYLLSNGMDGKLRLWNATSGEHQFMNYEGVHRTQPRAARNVQMAVVQESGAYESTFVFLPNGSDGALSSYRVFGDSGAQVESATAHYQQINACLYRKATRELYSAGEDGLIMKWKSLPTNLYPTMSTDVDSETPNCVSKAEIDALDDRDAWSDDDTDFGTGGHEFIPPILRDEY